MKSLSEFERVRAGVWARTAAAATILAVAGAASAQPVIRLVAPPANGIPYDFTSVAGLSADGSKVVGNAYYVNGGRNDGLTWSIPVGTTKIGNYAPMTAISADGDVYANSITGPGPEIRNSVVVRSGGSTVLWGFDGSNDKSIASALSGDGSVAVGRGADGGANHAAQWNAAGVISSLGDIPGGTLSSNATDVSLNGSVIVGSANSTSGSRAFRWNQTDGMVSLGTLPTFAVSFGKTVTADGQTIFGESRPTANGTATGLAFKWTSSDGMLALPLLSGGSGSGVTDASADGSVAVGVVYFGSTSVRRAALFTSNGTIDFLDYIQSLGVDLTGWNPTSLTLSNISGDGTVIAGAGLYNGASRGFVIGGMPVPAPGIGAVLGLSGLLASRRRR